MTINLFDKRVARRNIQKGLITQQEYLDYLSALEDAAQKCQTVNETLYPDEDEIGEAPGEVPESPGLEF